MSVAILAHGLVWPRVSRWAPRVPVVGTHGPGEEFARALELLQGGVRRVIAAGGDGFVRAAAEAFFEDEAPAFPGAELAIVPAGTGNDLARMLGIPSRPAEAFALALSGAARPIDVAFLSGAVSARLFLNIAEAGMGAAAVARAGRWGKPLGGRLGYALGTLASLAYRPPRFAVRVDGREVHAGPALNVIVANGRHFGAGMCPVPAARPDDGRLDVRVVAPLPLLDRLVHLPRMRAGLPATHSALVAAHGVQVEVRAEPAAPFEADGDVLGTTPVRVRLRAGALAVVRP